MLLIVEVEDIGELNWRKAAKSFVTNKGACGHPNLGTTSYRVIFPELQSVKAPLLVLDPSTDREEDLRVMWGPKTSPSTVSLAGAMPSPAPDSPSSQHPLPHAANAGCRNTVLAGISSAVECLPPPS
jgi:hypothetical protein